MSRRHFKTMWETKVGLGGVLVCLAVLVAVEMHQFSRLGNQELFQTQLLIVASTTITAVSGYYVRRLGAEFVFKIDNGIDR